MRNSALVRSSITRFRAEESWTRPRSMKSSSSTSTNEGDDFHFIEYEELRADADEREELGETVYYLIPAPL